MIFFAIVFYPHDKIPLKSNYKKRFEMKGTSQPKYEEPYWFPLILISPLIVSCSIQYSTVQLRTVKRTILYSIGNLCSNLHLFLFLSPVLFQAISLCDRNVSNIEEQINGSNTVAKQYFV